MLYVALGELVLIGLLVVSFLGVIRSLSRAHARREDLLLNQLLHATGKPWQLAPADTPLRPAVDEEYEHEMPDWSATPEQLPVY